jgi:hypothetical protein
VDLVEVLAVAAVYEADPDNLPVAESGREVVGGKPGRQAF